MDNHGALLKQCLATSGVGSVVSFGDSNGGRHAGVMYNMFKSFRRKSCFSGYSEQLDESGFLPDRDYFLKSNQNWTEFVQVHYRYCRTCKSQRHTCHVTYGNETRDVRLEHIAMTMILDDSIQLNVPDFKTGYGKIEEIFAITTQQFILRYYLAEEQPDVVIVFLPFNHAKYFPLDISTAEIQYFHSMAKYYLPKSVKIFYMPTLSEFEERRLVSVWVNKTYDGMLAAEKINILNQRLFDVLYPDLTAKDGKIFAFLDLFKLSESKGKWSEDGIHMEWKWYTHIMAMFWEIYCNSVFLNAF
jgi:hypothetical protein